jgi:hypothetical protein
MNAASPILIEARARGLKRFFTGKPCKYGHVSERTVSGQKCVACLLIYEQERYAADPAPKIAKTAAYYARNKARMDLLRANWRAANKDHIRQYERAWRRDNGRH